MYKAIVLSDHQSVVQELNELEAIGVTIDSATFGLSQNRVGVLIKYTGDIEQLQADADKKRQIKAELIAEAQKKSSKAASEKQDAAQKKAREEAAAKAKSDAEEAVKVAESAKIEAAAIVKIEKERAEEAKKALDQKVEQKARELSK